MAKNCDTGIYGHGVSTQVIQLMLTRCGDSPVELLDPSNLLFFSDRVAVHILLLQYTADRNNGQEKAGKKRH